MAFQTLGAVSVNIKASETAAKKAAENLAAQRRIYEAEQAQKSAVAASEELQGTVMKWLPRVAIGMGLLVGGYFVWQKMRRK